MVEPDPWNVIEKNQENTHNCVTNSESNANPSAFEDNFLTQTTNVADNLPDSKEYIQALGIFEFFSIIIKFKSKFFMCVAVFFSFILFLVAISVSIIECANENFFSS